MEMWLHRRRCRLPLEHREVTCRSVVRFVPHHVAHAASSCLASPFASCAVLVLDGRGERGSHLAAHFADDGLQVLAAQSLPHSIGLLFEDLTEHLGFHRSSDEYKVMAMASYGRPRFLDALRSLVTTDGRGGFCVQACDWSEFAPLRVPGAEWGQEHADLASSVQHRLEEVLLDLAWWLHGCTHEPKLWLMVVVSATAFPCASSMMLGMHGACPRTVQGGGGYCST